MLIKLNDMSSVVYLSIDVVITNHVLRIISPYIITNTVVFCGSEYSFVQTSWSSSSIDSKKSFCSMRKALIAGKL